MSKPTHIAYVVNKKDANDKGFWRPVGVVFPHRDGNGFELVIHDQLSVSGRIVCRVAKDTAATTSAANVVPLRPGEQAEIDDNIPF